jgi:uncharacterized protein YggE
MPIRFAAAVTIVTIALLALACDEQTRIEVPEQQAPGITVAGRGSVFGAPDVALLTLGVEAQAATVGEARTQAAQRMDAMVQSLKDGGVADEDIQTTRFSVQPQYDFVEGRQELRGFLVSNVATVKIREIDNTGALIDEALAAGGDLARVEQLSFTIDDPTALENEARTKAVQDARARAETLAEAAGVELGDARSIVESSAPVRPVDFGGDAAEVPQAGDVGSPIELGELEVEVQVQVVYGLD